MILFSRVELLVVRFHQAKLLNTTQSTNMRLKQVLQLILMGQVGVDDKIDSFYMTFDGTYFSIFNMVDAYSYDTDQTNKVIEPNRFTIKINNDGTASYEITPK